MKKASRLMILLLALLVACGVTVAACADVAGLGIYLCGVSTLEDGTEITVPLEGSFRVMVNGVEAGIIRAGKDTLTITDLERVRIVPMPETISPDWDLSGAAREVYPEAGATVTVPVVLRPLTAEAALQTPAPIAPTVGESAGESSDGDLPDEEAETGEAGGEDDEPVALMAASTPTLPPFDASVLAPTPEPDWITLPAGSSSVRVFAYQDLNSNGLVGDNDKGVSGITVCLLTGAEEAVGYAITGSDGMAAFENLPAGEYRLKAILPNGYGFSKKGDGTEPYASVFASSFEGEGMSDAFSVQEGQEATRGIALNRTLHVSGQCWFETTPDGLFENGEPTLPGVKIELDGMKNGLHYETVSDADGLWYIDRVSPAAYNLTVTAPEGMMFARVSNRGGRRSILTRDGANKASRKVDLNDKESKEKLYIGFTWAGQISGRCFLDANYNGLYDEGELPMAGVKITAIKQSKDEEVAVTYSGEDGTYTLQGLRGNTYRMRAVLPEDGSDFSKTVDDPLGNHFKSRPGRRENFWNDFVLKEAEQREMNVGVIYPGSVTGTVYMDNDFSATLTGSEKIVSGYLVTLLDEEGNVAASDKTSVRGKYELTRLVPGNYSLSVTALKGYAFTRLGEGNVILNRTGGEGYSETFFLALGENRKDMDIGMILPGTVKGAVFADRNDNGLRDAGEEGLPGVTVRLMSEEGEAFRAEIGEDGNYLFDAVMPGRYYLEYQLPDKAVFARAVSGGNEIVGENGVGRGEAFDFASGDEVTGPVCGALTLGRLEGLAFMDHDGDGLRADGEEALEGLTVTLTPARQELEAITAATDENGAFALSPLRPDTYTLTVTCPDGRVLSRTDGVQLPLTAGKATQETELTVAMGAEWTDQLLGAVLPAALGGQLWLDENNNGLFDVGERTPAGLALTVTDDLTGRVFDTLLTDAEGRFETSGMIPGNFTVSFPLDENTIAPREGDSNFTERAGRLEARGIALTENENRQDLLVGIVRYTSVGGRVWIDRGDGAAEPLAEAVISLLDGEGKLLLTQTTGEDGGYRFDRLMPGDYQLSARMPEGCVIIEPGDRRLEGGLVSVIAQALNREGSSQVFALSMDENRLQMDVGCVLPGRLGDLCWLDLDGDGLQGTGEPGIPNVRIELLRDGAPVAETVTDAWGFYRFSDLYPATYTLRVTAPEEVKPTRRRTDIPMIVSVLEEGGEGPFVSAEVTVESDRANYNADLGLVPRKDGVWPAGVGEAPTQDWTGIAGSDK